MPKYSINTIKIYEVTKNGDTYTKTSNVLYVEPANSTELGVTTTTGETVYSYVDSDGSTVKYYCKHSSAYSVGAHIEWRVRTAGVTKIYGDWSIKRTIDVYAPPTLVLNVIDDDGNVINTVTTFPFYI